MTSYEQLLTFVRIVETGSISGAARTLGISGSGVSRNLIRLERRLQARLVERSTRALHVTTEGKIFYSAALRALQSLDEAERSVTSIRTVASGTLRVSCLPTFARYQLAPRLPRFLEQNPDVRIELLLTNDHVDLVKEGLDVAITLGPMPDSSYVVKPLTRCRWLICASPAYLLKNGVPKSAADIRLHNCLGFTMRNTTWNDWAFKNSGTGTESSVTIRGNIAVNMGDVLRDLAIAGVGLARLGEVHIRDDIALGRLVEVLLESHSDDYETLQAIYPHRQHVSGRVARFLQFLEDEFAGRELWNNLPAADSPADVQLVTKSRAVAARFDKRTR